MALTDKKARPAQEGTVPRGPVSTPQSVTPATPPPSALQVTASAVRDSLLEKRPYLKFAFANPYNLSLVIGGLAAAVLTANPLLALVALGSEALWLLHAPESARLRHLLWDPRFEQLKLAYEEQARAERMKMLAEPERQRVDRLVRQKRDIQRLASQNPSFTADLLRGELVKTDRLVESFLDMAVTCARYEQYLGTIDVAGLDRDRDRWEKAIKVGAAGDQQVDIARKNLAIIMKRFEKVQEIRKYLNVARGQLDLIENSFQLLADQIVTMQSPQELSGQLDEMLNGVQAIRDSTADTERLLASMGLPTSM
jgi:hypothetical protein